MTEDHHERTQQCDECGSGLYRVKWEYGEGGIVAWAECAECGRPTRRIGHGAKKIMDWEHDQQK